MPRSDSKYLDTYRTPSACHRVAPVRRITPEERAKDVARTFKEDQRDIRSGLQARSNPK